MEEANPCAAKRPRTDGESMAETRDNGVAEHHRSEFDSRTEKDSAAQYFQFYGYLHQQQNMLQDYQRTATYQRAIHDNWPDFDGKVVMDVGAGSGILSFFAAQAGAKRVYAVEASSMAEQCRQLVKANGQEGRIHVVLGRVEEMRLEEEVDVIVSEPMGYMLVNERMLESFVHARKWLRKGGRMYPAKADLHFALYSDESLYLEQMQRGMFWSQPSFHGVDLRSLGEKALEEVFSQPVVDTWHPDILVSDSVKWNYDFEHDDVEKLQRMEVPFELTATRSCIVHGLASWFDVLFDGTTRKVWLSTSPTEPLTHWYQVRCALRQPISVREGQIIKGRVVMTANEKQSYDIQMELEVAGTQLTNILDLKAPYFRYTGQPVSAPPGTSQQCPSEKLIGSGGQHYYFAATTDVGIGKQCPGRVENSNTRNGDDEYLSDSSPARERTDASIPSPVGKAPSKGEESWR